MDSRSATSGIDQLVLDHRYCYLCCTVHIVEPFPWMIFYSTYSSVDGVILLAAHQVGMAVDNRILSTLERESFGRIIAPPLLL